MCPALAFNYCRMAAFRKSTRVATVTRPFIALMLLGQWLLLLAFSTSDRLHHSICDRAQQPSHDCAFASVAKGQLSAFAETVRVPLPRNLEIDLPIQRPLSLRPIEDIRLAPDRGPPENAFPT